MTNQHCEIIFSSYFRVQSRAACEIFFFIIYWFFFWLCNIMVTIQSFQTYSFFSLSFHIQTIHTAIRRKNWANLILHKGTVCVRAGWGWGWGSVKLVTEASNTKLPPFRQCMNTWHVRKCASVCVDKCGGASCAPDVDLTSLLAVPVLNKPHCRSGRQRKGLILHIRPHPPRLLIQACKSPICFWVSLSLSLSL